MLVKCKICSKMAMMSESDIELCTSCEQEVKLVSN